MRIASRRITKSLANNRNQINNGLPQGSPFRLSQTYITNKVAQKSLLLWEKGDHEVVDEELLCVKNTSSVGFAATFPR